MGGKVGQIGVEANILGCCGAEGCQGGGGGGGEGVVNEFCRGGLEVEGEKRVLYPGQE